MICTPFWMHVIPMNKFTGGTESYTPAPKSHIYKLTRKMSTANTHFTDQNGAQEAVCGDSQWKETGRKWRSPISQDDSLWLGTGSSFLASSPGLSRHNCPLSLSPCPSLVLPQENRVGERQFIWDSPPSWAVFLKHLIRSGCQSLTRSSLGGCGARKANSEDQRKWTQVTQVSAKALCGINKCEDTGKTCSFCQ